MNRSKVRQYVLWVIAADFPVLYFGTVTAHSSTITIAALAVLGLTSAAAVLAY